MELLYHMFGHILGVYSLNHSPKKSALYMVGTSIAIDQQVNPWTSCRTGPPRPGSPRRPGRAGGVPPQRGDAARAVGAAGGPRRAANWILGFSMDFHGFKWIFIDANGFSWIQMEFDGFE